MSSDHVKILLIEDNPGDARLIREMLNETQSASFLLEWRDRLSSGLQKLAEDGADVLLLDLGLTDSQGLGTYEKAQSQFPRMPIVVLSGLQNESVAVNAVRAGAQDYLVKGQIEGKLLARSIRYAIERKSAEEKLQEAHASLERRLEDRTLELLKLNDLTKDLLEYKQAVTKKIQLKPIFFTAVVEKAISNLKAVIDANNAEVIYDDMPTVMADASQLISLFQNLIDNAIKYRRADKPIIQISTEQKENEWLFSIRDNGIGIDSENSERIFGMFQRLNTDRPGTGIGLATCKEIVERHGGRIWVAPKTGDGAIICFTLAYKTTD